MAETPIPAAAPQKSALSKSSATPVRPAEEIRFLLRCATQVSLGTLGRADEGGNPTEPYVSLALMSVDHTGAPLLLLSDLAEHSHNLAERPRVSLLVQGSGDFTDPLEGSRVSVQGSIQTCQGEEKTRWLARFVRRFPSARLYAGFKDFQLYRVTPTRAHLVAGFGRIHWVTADAFLFEDKECQALAEAEAGIVEHMNDDHLDALDVIVRAFLDTSATGAGQPAAGEEDWRMVGIDPEGFDLRAGRQLSRLAFADPQFAKLGLVGVIHNSSEARKNLVILTQEARRALAV